MSETKGKAPRGGEKKKREGKAKNPVGAPVTVWTPEKREATRRALEAYIDATDIPIISEFAYKNGMGRTQVYDIAELGDALKRAVAKKEANLERFALENRVNVTMAIFSLKQLGWKDKAEVEHSGAVGVKIIDDVR